MPDKVRTSSNLKLSAKVVEDVNNKKYSPAVTPFMTKGGNVSVLANGGANPVTFPSQSCSQLTIANNTGAVIEFQQDANGPYFPLFTGTYYTIFGITNSNQISVRRVDQAVTGVTVTARWEY